MIDWTWADYLFWDILLSSLRWGCGLSIGMIFAFLIALFYQSRFYRLRTAIEHIIDFLRAIPILAIVPFVAWWLGPRESGKLLIIAIASGCIVSRATIDSLQRPAVDLELFLHGARLPRKQMLLLYQVPRICSSLAGGTKLAVGVAWISVVAAEMTGTYRAGFWSGGLGYRLQACYEDSSWAGMIAGMVVFGILGLCSTKAVNFMASWLARRTAIKL